MDEMCFDNDPILELVLLTASDFVKYADTISVGHFSRFDLNVYRLGLGLLITSQFSCTII